MFSLIKLAFDAALLLAAFVGGLKFASAYPNVTAKIVAKL